MNRSRMSQKRNIIFTFFMLLVVVVVLGTAYAFTHHSPTRIDGVRIDTPEAQQWLECASNEQHLGIPCTADDVPWGSW